MTDTIILPDGRGVTFAAAPGQGTPAIDFTVYDPDGTVQAGGLTVTGSADNARLSVMGVRSAEDGAGIEVFFHEDLFVPFDDGTIYATTFGAGAPATRVVSEQFHLFPQTNPARLSLEDGRLLYGADTLDAPDPETFLPQRLFPTSFAVRIFPYSQDIVERPDGGVVWATMSRTAPFDTSPVQVHLFDAAFAVVDTGIPVGSDRHRANEGDLATLLDAVSIAALADGSYAVAWTTERFASSDRTGPAENGVFLSILDARLQTVVREIPLAPPGDQVQEKPQVYALDGGGFSVAWQNREQGNFRFTNDLVIQTFDGDGTLVGEEAVSRDVGAVAQDFDTEDLVISGDGTTFFMGAEAALMLADRPATTGGDGTPPVDGPGDGPDEVRGDGLLEGFGGDDTIIGGTGDDTLDGGSGDDLMTGGGGSDIYIVDSRGDRVIEQPSAPGTDEVRTSVSYRLDGGVERLVATGDGNLRLEGTPRAEALIGNDGRNILVGEGADTMTGGGGDDFFVLTARSGAAPEVTITDFSDGDVLVVDDQLLGFGRARIEPRELTREVLGDLIAGGAVSYRPASGELRIDLDGDGTRELVATLEGGARLGLEDVLLV